RADGPRAGSRGERPPGRRGESPGHARRVLVGRGHRERSGPSALNGPDTVDVIEPVPLAPGAPRMERRERLDAIVLDRVSRSYGAIPVVQEVSLSVGGSEFVTLLGPTGSGKTTVLLMIAGFVMPDRGRILLGGANATGLRAHDRNIGVVFQSYA